MNITLCGFLLFISIETLEPNIDKAKIATHIIIYWVDWGVRIICKLTDCMVPGGPLKGKEKINLGLDFI